MTVNPISLSLSMVSGMSLYVARVKMLIDSVESTGIRAWAARTTSPKPTTAMRSLYSRAWLIRGMMSCTVMGMSTTGTDGTASRICRVVSPRLTRTLAPCSTSRRAALMPSSISPRSREKSMGVSGRIFSKSRARASSGATTAMSRTMGTSSLRCPAGMGGRERSLAPDAGPGTSSSWVATIVQCGRPDNWMIFSNDSGE